MGHLLVGNLLVEDDRKQVYHRHMGLEHSRDGKDPRSGLAQEGSHQLVDHGHVEESDSDHGHHRSSCGEVGFYHGSRHHDEDYNHGMGHGDRSHHLRNHHDEVLENGSELEDREAYQVVSKMGEQG